MKNYRGIMSFVVVTLATLYANQIQAWGGEGHQAVGALAIEQLSPAAKAVLVEIMGTGDLEELSSWCNWPDEFRSTEEGAWTAPQHYINMVPGAMRYDRIRDCPTGMCLTESIILYADELADTALPQDVRQRAFGRVCHFVGDIHQPLHAGFGHDRGGNLVKILYKGEESDIHSYWDHLMIEAHAANWLDLFNQLKQSITTPESDLRSGYEVEWTNESHELAVTRAYPGRLEINEDFARKSWEMAQAQLLKGGSRLAQVLNAALTQAEKKAGCALKHKAESD